MLTPTDQLERVEASLPVDVLDAPVSVDERRASGRVHARVAAELVGDGGGERMSCEAVDIGEGGICVEVDAAAGIMLGQRFQVVVKSGAGIDGGLAQLFCDGVYATVVRTTAMQQGEHPRVNAGLRFDQPLIFDGFGQMGTA